MNKILNSVKNSLLIINFLLILYWIKQNGIENYFILYIIGFMILSFITIKDICNQVKPNERYSILFIVVELLVNFLFLRAFFDPSFICNSSNYKEIIQTIYTTYGDICAQFRVNYFNQNIIYIFILYITLYMFHKLEYPQQSYRPSKYSKASILLCLINVLTIPTIAEEAYHSTFPILFFLLEIGLVLAEITTLILYNHKKKDYPIYICFLFNLFAFISIFV